MPNTSTPARSAASISSSRFASRSSALRVTPVAGSETTAAKLSIPICTNPPGGHVPDIGALPDTNQFHSLGIPRTGRASLAHPGPATDGPRRSGGGG